MTFKSLLRAARAGGAVAGALLGAVPAAAQQLPPPGQELESGAGIRILPGDETRARIYAHSGLGYSIAVPAGVRMGERGPRRDLLIQSRRGFDLSLQTGGAAPSRPLSAMAGRLESLYLGAGKPWTRKISGDKTRAAGLPAYSAVYEGGNTRTRALIVRGAVNDFVFLFRAAPGNFTALEREFRWMLENFIPAQTEYAAQTAAAAPEPEPESAAPRPAAALQTPAPEPAAPESAPGPGPAPSPKPKPEPEQEAAPEPAPAPDSALPDSAPPDSALILFPGKGLGYTIRYPSGWSAAKTSDFTAAFFGPPEGNGRLTTVSVQNVHPPGASGPADAAKRAALNIRDQLSGQADNAAFLSAGAYLHDYGGAALKGWQFTVSYDLEGRRWRQWTVVTPRAQGPVVHVWSYAAPDADFDARRPEAARMLKSWRIGPQQQQQQQQQQQ